MPTVNRLETMGTTEPLNLVPISEHNVSTSSKASKKEPIGVQTGKNVIRDNSASSKANSKMGSAKQ